MDDITRKKHRARQSGTKAEKKNAKKRKTEGKPNDPARNPKAFSIQSVKKTARIVRRKADIQSKKQHVPQVDRTPVEPPPIVVAVVGPPKVGKTTLVRGLIKNWTRQSVREIKGPVTVVSGKSRRVTLLECPSEMSAMIDVAKVADLVLLLVDASFGFEMEVFEFLNICQVHGFPRIMGVLTHLDTFKNVKRMRSTKKQLKHRFWTEIYQGAKLFYLSGLVNGSYPKMEIHNLARFISIMKFHPLQWRSTHPYCVTDRMEDLTDEEMLRQNEKVDRRVSLYGYVRGTHLKPQSKVHIPGCGDFRLDDVSVLSDPCPLPEQLKKRSLSEKERLVYAPMSGLGGIVYDKDAVYIETHHKSGEQQDEKKPSNEIILSLMETQHTVDSKMEASQLTLVKGGVPITSARIDKEPSVDHSHSLPDDGRYRRKAVFLDGKTNESINNSDTDSDFSGEFQEKLQARTKQRMRGGKGGPENNISVESVEVDDDDTASDESESNDKYELDDNNDNDDNDDDDNYDDDDDKLDDKHESSQEDLVRWKTNLFEEAASAFRRRQKADINMQKLVYGKDNSDSDNEGETDSEVGGLFTRRKSTKDSLMHQEDDSSAGQTTAHNWTDELIAQVKRLTCVTGQWSEDEDAATRLAQDEELYGEFEDLETGETYTGITDVDNEEKEQQENEERKKKKQKLKAQFDAEYDEGDDAKYYEDLKQAVNEQAELNRQAFEDVGEEARAQLEGYRPGLYVRLEISGVPCEFVKQFSPCTPLIVGGIASGEDQMGYIQTRLKKHRWHKRILKNRDPLIISLGWRQFQTLPLYSVQDHNGRHRLVKYTPEHMHCIATFYGPITPQGTGLLAVQSLRNGSVSCGH
jgi:ribosome biogenesis protein BMS1